MVTGAPPARRLATGRRGTLPNQMAVSGFQGHGLVNSYIGGDRSTGTLESPQVKIDRRYINFLIGGGHHPGNLHQSARRRQGSTYGDRSGCRWRQRTARLANLGRAGSRQS